MKIDKLVYVSEHMHNQPDSEVVKALHCDEETHQPKFWIPCKKELEQYLSDLEDQVLETRLLLEQEERAAINAEKWEKELKDMTS